MCGIWVVESHSINVPAPTTITTWWFQPTSIWKILVCYINWIISPNRGEIKQYLKPPPSPSIDVCVLKKNTPPQTCYISWSYFQPPFRCVYQKPLQVARRFLMLATSTDRSVLSKARGNAPKKWRKLLRLALEGGCDEWRLMMVVMNDELHGWVNRDPYFVVTLQSPFN